MFCLPPPPPSNPDDSVVAGEEIERMCALRELSLSSPDCMGGGRKAEESARRIKIAARMEEWCSDKEEEGTIIKAQLNAFHVEIY